MPIAKMTKGFMILAKEIPDDFIAASSYLSAKLPIVITDAKSIAILIAIGTSEMDR